jgi:hypothetical protein
MALIDVVLAIGGVTWSWLRSQVLSHFGSSNILGHYGSGTIYSYLASSAGSSWIYSSLYDSQGSSWLIGKLASSKGWSWILSQIPGTLNVTVPQTKVDLSKFNISLQPVWNQLAAKIASIPSQLIARWKALWH